MADITAAPVLLLGATTGCGQALIDRLAGQGLHIAAVSRQAPDETKPHVFWLQQDLDQATVSFDANVLIGTGPLIHVIRQLEDTPRLGRIVAISSASTEFKSRSEDSGERDLMERLAEQEQILTARCRQRGVPLTLLKPTMIYGGERNANVQRIGALSDRLHWLPYCGRGLRHPVHADDLAKLIIDCLARGEASAGPWLLGGGEVLNYPAMLTRIASARGGSPKLIRLPVGVMKGLLSLAHLANRLNDVKPVMLQRQAMDLVVDDSPARERLSWNPRPFRP